MNQPIANIIAGLYSPYDYEAITVTNATAIGATTTKIKQLGNDSVNYLNAVRMVISVETAPFRYRYDGTDPTTTEGHLVPAGASFVIHGQEAIEKFRAIATTATDATLRVTYER